MSSQTGLSISSKNFVVTVQGITITDTNLNTCTYTLQYSTDGVNWTNYGTYTDQVSVTTQPDAGTTSSGGGFSGETRTLPL